MNIQEIKLDLISPNDYNPNEMLDKTLKTLRRSIERDGFLQPIVIRENPEKEGAFLIIDGEHRYTVMKEFNKETIPALVMEADESEAMVLTINLNRIKGIMSATKLADIIQDLGQRFSENELEDYLGYNAEELQRFSELLDMQRNGLNGVINETQKPNISDKELEDLLENSTPDLTAKSEELTISLSKVQLASVTAVLDSTENPDKGEAVANICREFLRSNYPEKLQAIEDKFKTAKKQPAES